MNEQHANVTQFVAQYTASMSKEQHRAFWKKFRKAANAYAETQAERITKLEEENNRLKSSVKVIHTWASFDGGIELIPDDVIKLTTRTLQIPKIDQTQAPL